MKTSEIYPFNYDNFLKLCTLLDEYEPIPVEPPPEVDVTHLAASKDIWAAFEEEDEE
jgi:hypothetical protein